MELYGFDVSDWTDDSRDALEIIAKHAKKRETITYGQLVQTLGRRCYIPVNVGKRLLDDLDQRTHERAGCAISAIIVNNRTQVSGKGLNDVGRDLKMAGATGRRFRTEQQEKVFRYFESL